jgi:hypothetical protein
MTKQEFETLAGQQLSDDDYGIVETVYAFYPGIPDVDGKKIAVQLYRQFGLTIFQDMYERANKISEIESAIQEQKRQLEYVTRAPLRSILA